MRKLILILFSVVLCLPTFAQQKVRIEKVDPDTAKEFVQYRTRSNHWSIMGAVGLGKLDADQKQAREYLFPKTLNEVNGLFNIEYTVNPRWGIFLEYLYNPYGGQSKYYNRNAVPQTVAGKEGMYKFTGRNHEFSLGISVNVLNLFYRVRSQKFQWYVNAGAGLSVFDMRSHEAFPNGDYSGDVLHVIPDDGKKDKKDFLTQSKGFTFPVGTTLEWNATRWLAILANVQYRFHTEDYYDASVSGNENDGTLFAGIGFRWKINNFKKKNIYHVRDMSMGQYEPNMAEQIAKQALKKVDSIKPLIDNLDNKINKLEPRVKSLEDKVDYLNSDTDKDGVLDFLDKCPKVAGTIEFNGCPDTDKDGVPDHLDKCPKVAGTIANKGCPEIKAEVKKIFAQALQGIQFETAKADIKPTSFPILDKVVQVMKDNTSYNLEIYGHTDSQGDDAANLELSDRRAASVMQYLINKGISAARLSSKGYGETQPIADNKTAKGRYQNRRVEFKVNF